jgi:hypothetical protein
MRYRGKVNVQFKSGNNVTVEHVAIADNIDDANKKCMIEFLGDYKNNPNVESFEIEPCVEDFSEKPTRDFVIDCLKKINNVHTIDSIKNRTTTKLREEFLKYQPSFDEDNLWDVLSYCEYGELERKYHSYKYAADMLLAELDHEWVCHYMPDEDLEAQYLACLGNNLEEAR